MRAKCGCFTGCLCACILTIVICVWLLAVAKTVSFSGWSSVNQFPIGFYVKKTFGDGATGLQWADALPVTLPTVSEHWKKPVTVTPTWKNHHAFFIHCRTLEGRGVAPFTSVPSNNYSETDWTSLTVTNQTATNVSCFDCWWGVRKTCRSSGVTVSRPCLWGPEARAFSEFSARRHVMKRASPRIFAVKCC